MNKRQAEAVARDIERHGLRVTGFRRYDYGRKGSSWAVDVVDKATGYPFTVDNAEAWQELRTQYGNVTATPGRPPLSPDGVRMTYHSTHMTDAQWAWAERDGVGKRSANVRRAVDAVRLLTPEQWAWLTRRDDAPAALEDAVRQAMLTQQEAA